MMEMGEVLLEKHKVHSDIGGISPLHDAEGQVALDDPSRMHPGAKFIFRF